MNLTAPSSFASQSSGMRKAKENKLNVHSGIHTSLCDITTGFLVFVFLKIVVKATLETVLVASMTRGPVDVHVQLPHRLIPNDPLGMMHTGLIRLAKHLASSVLLKCPTLWTNVCFSMSTLTSFVCVSAKTVLKMVSL